MDGIDADNVADHLLQLSRDAPADRPCLHAARRARGHEARAGVRAPAAGLARAWATSWSRWATTSTRCRTRTCRATKWPSAKCRAAPGTLALQGPEFLPSLDELPIALRGQHALIQAHFSHHRRRPRHAGKPGSFPTSRRRPPAARRSGCPPRAASRWCSTSIPRTTRRAAPTKGMQFRDLYAEFQKLGCARLWHLARQPQVARELQGQDELPVRPAVRPRRSACARCSA